MALHNIKITVIDGGKAAQNWGSDLNSDTTNKKKKKEKSKLYKILNLNQTIRSSVKQAVTPGNFYAVQSGVSLATQIAKQAISYYVSDIGRKSGDSNYQATVARKIEQATDIMSIVGGALSGAGSGAAFGVGGAVFGTVVGAASSAISLGYKYAERERTYAHEMFKLENSQAYNLTRANYSALTGRVR